MLSASDSVPLQRQVKRTCAHCGQEVGRRGSFPDWHLLPTRATAELGTLGYVILDYVWQTPLALSAREGTVLLEGRDGRAQGMRKQIVVERQLAADRAAAFVDARNLALELAGMHSAASLDPMVAGVVLRPGESLRRLVNAWLRQRAPEGWTEPSWSQVFVTDERLLVRLGSGELASLWWGSLVGFEADLPAEHVVLDFGDGQPRLLSGPSAAVLAVAGVAALYGPEALATHPALSPLRADRYVTSSALPTD
jgi:hypothetical protein